MQRSRCIIASFVSSCNASFVSSCNASFVASCIVSLICGVRQSDFLLRPSPPIPLALQVRFGGGRLQDYIINSNTNGDAFVNNIVQDKATMVPPEQVTRLPHASLLFLSCTAVLYTAVVYTAGLCTVYGCGLTSLSNDTV